jgi:hypothetical protein
MTSRTREANVFIDIEVGDVFPFRPNLKSVFQIILSNQQRLDVYLTMTCTVSHGKTTPSLLADPSPDQVQPMST